METSVLRAAVAEDVDKLAELRAVVMRPDLERLGRYDEHRVRQRLRDTFSPQYTSVITVDGDLAGCITVRPAEDGVLLEHFYLSPEYQGLAWARTFYGACSLGCTACRSD